MGLKGGRVTHPRPSACQLVVILNLLLRPFPTGCAQKVVILTPPAALPHWLHTQAGGGAACARGRPARRAGGGQAGGCYPGAPAGGCWRAAAGAAQGAGAGGSGERGLPAAVGVPPATSQSAEGQEAVGAGSVGPTTK